VAVARESIPNRNGGRHCCQPPLRRAKDLPVFVTWQIKPFGPSTRSRSWLTSSGVASDQTIPSCEEPGDLLDCASRRFAGLSTFRPVHENRSSLAKTVRCSAALLGIISLASRFAHLDSEEPREPRRATGRPSLPAPLPGWPREEPESSSHCLPAEIGSSVPSSAKEPRPFQRDWDIRPDHLSTMHVSSESRKQNFR
jgi:hypothetical protein